MSGDFPRGSRVSSGDLDRAHAQSRAALRSATGPRHQRFPSVNKLERQGGSHTTRDRVEF